MAGCYSTPERKLDRSSSQTLFPNINDFDGNAEELSQLRGAESLPDFLPKQFLRNKEGRGKPVCLALERSRSLTTDLDGAPSAVRMEEVMPELVRQCEALPLASRVWAKCHGEFLRPSHEDHSSVSERLRIAFDDATTLTMNDRP